MLKQQKIFFDFLRFCIGSAKEIPGSLKEVDWKELYVIAKKQCLVGVLFDGIKKLPAEYVGMKKELLLQWMAESQMLEKTNVRLNDAAIQVSEECKKRFIVSGYRIKYYEALKEVIDRSEWPAFFDELWKMPDWEHDYEDAEAKILIKEERLDLLKDMFVHKHWNLWELSPEYIKYVPKQDHAFVGEILFKDIKRLALLKEKPKEFNWLLGQIERVMRKSAAVDKIIKNGIRQLIADYPDKYYFKSYLGSIL